MRVAIFASGNGSNFSVLTKALVRRKDLGSVDLLFCDKPKAYVIERAKKLGISVVSFSPSDFPSKADYEEALLKVLRDFKIDFIILAGYMRVIGQKLLMAYPQQIINIHPSLLPDFPGLHGIRDAFEAGVSETGVTIHYIDEGVDTGPIIIQERVSVTKKETLASLEEKIHQVEHRLYPSVLLSILENRKEQTR